MYHYKIYIMVNDIIRWTNYSKSSKVLFWKRVLIFKILKDSWFVRPLFWIIAFPFSSLYYRLSISYFILFPFSFLFFISRSLFDIFLNEYTPIFQFFSFPLFDNEQSWNGRGNQLAAGILPDWSFRWINPGAESDYKNRWKLKMRRIKFIK